MPCPPRMDQKEPASASLGMVPCGVDDEGGGRGFPPDDAEGAGGVRPPERPSGTGKRTMFAQALELGGVGQDPPGGGFEHT